MRISRVSSLYAPFTLALVAACSSADDASPTDGTDGAIDSSAIDTAPSKEDTLHVDTNDANDANDTGSFDSNETGIVDAAKDGAADAVADAVTDASLDASADASGGCTAWIGATDGKSKVIGVYSLPKSTLLKSVDPLLTDADVTAGVASGALADGPGPGSGLEYLGGCSFAMVTDRGPNVDHLTSAGKVDGKVFPMLAFTPTIVTVGATGSGTGTLAIEATLPILDASGGAVTGLPNGDPTSGFYDVVFGSIAGTTPLTFEGAAGGFAVGSRHVSGGLDTEDVRRLPSGDFVVVDEYSPSISIVDGKTGHVKVRYVPDGLAIAGAPYPVKAILPKIFLQRRINKGFEGLAVSADGKTIYAVLQGSMGDDKTYGATLVNRVVVLDLTSPLDASVIGQYVVLHDTAVSYGAAAKDQAKVYFNSATWLRKDHLLMLERVSGRMRLVDVDLAAATNLTGAAATTLDPEDVSGASGKGYAAMGITPGKRTVVFDTADLATGSLYATTSGGVDPDKIEGLAIVDANTIAIANDDDFGIGTNPGEVSRVWVLRLPAPLMLATP